MLALILILAQTLSKKIQLGITTTPVDGYQDVYYDITLQDDNGNLLEESNVKIVLYFMDQRTLISENWIVYSLNGKVNGKITACCNNDVILNAEADGYTTGISEKINRGDRTCFHFHPPNGNVLTQLIDNEVLISLQLFNPISNFSPSFLEVNGNQVVSYKVGTHTSSQLDLYLIFESVFEEKLFITYGDYHTTWTNLKIKCDYKLDLTFPDGYPLYAKLLFSLSASVLDYLTGENSNKIFSVEITSTPENSLIGTTVKNTEKGVGLFENLIISQAGSYNMKAKATGLCRGYLDLTVSPPLALKAIIISKFFLTTNSVFSVKVQIFNSDFSIKVTKYTLTLNIKLDSNEEISGVTTSNSLDGEFLFTSLSIHTEGAYTITAYSNNCTEGKTEEFIVYGLYLKLILDSDPPLTTNDYFAICVEVYLESAFSTLSIFEKYLITLTPVPDSVIEGDLIEYTLLGARLFYNLRFSVESSVTFTASSPYAWPSDPLLLQVKNHFISVVFSDIIVYII
ncbi:hypothetical protein SteCoe_38726 [Stentor coeruleus]|uniref:Uncharacterized protein n=1 Tax=Stentor coeruleus TaxID=5963 RepID=A0A1R2AL34_9CILI|nr:hypothetical protein SteCoe_38726 [Stentor coeruleus]